MRKLFLFVLILFSAEALARGDGHGNISNNWPLLSKGKGRIWVQAGMVNLSGGPSLSVGYQRGLFTYDLQVRSWNTKYGSIKADADFNETVSFIDENGDIVDFPAFADDTSEFNRSRQDSDEWSILIFEPGFGVHTQVFDDFLPKLSHHGRFGLGLGSAKDKANDITFAVYNLSGEYGFQYLLDPKRRLSLDLSFSLHWGKMINGDQPSTELGRLPMLYYLSRLSVVYWL